LPSFSRALPAPLKNPVPEERKPMPDGSKYLKNPYFRPILGRLSGREKFPFFFKNMDFQPANFGSLQDKFVPRTVLKKSRKSGGKKAVGRPPAKPV
jgi:hypothetical protein